MIAVNFFFTIINCHYQFFSHEEFLLFASFFPLYCQASRRCGPPRHLPPSRSGALPRRPPVALLFLLLHPDQTCSLYFLLHSGTLFLEVIFIGSATGLCHLTRFSGKVSAALKCSFPSLWLTEVSRVLHLLAVPQAGLASWACLRCKCTGPSSQKGLRLGFDAL